MLTPHTVMPHTKTLQLVVLILSVSLCTRAEDLLEEFIWSTTDCPVGYEKCGVIIFCSPGTGLYGYQQVGGECISPGPLFRMKTGEDYFLTFVNGIEGTTSNLHTHGLHIAGAGNADDVTRHADFGECLDYAWNIKADHFGGTYWYHAHKHGSTNEQVSRGAFGMVVIEDNMNAMKVPTPETEAFLLNDKSVVVAKVNNRWQGNGVAGGATMNILADTWYRLRLAHVDPVAGRLLVTVPDTCEARMLAEDGVLHNSVPGSPASSFGSTGASRLDLAVSCSNSSTILVDDTPVVIFEVIEDGETLTPNPTPFDNRGFAWSPVRPFYLTSLLDVPAESVNTFSVTLSARAVNGQVFNPAVPLATLEYGQVQEWTLFELVAHPFHIHLYHFQIASEEGCGDMKYGEWYDVVMGSDTCKIRFRPIDVADRCILHCHFLRHEDNGAMAWVNVTSSDNSHPKQPTRNPTPEQYECTALLPLTVTPPAPSTCGESGARCSVDDDCCADLSCVGERRKACE